MLVEPSPSESPFTRPWSTVTVLYLSIFLYYNISFSIIIYVPWCVKIAVSRHSDHGDSAKWCEQSKKQRGGGIRDESEDTSLSPPLFLLNCFPTLWLCTALHYLNAWNRLAWIWQSAINAVTVGLGLLSTWIVECDYCTYQLWLFFHRLKLLMRLGNTTLLSHYHSCQTSWKTFRFARKPEHDDSLNHRQPVG